MSEREEFEKWLKENWPNQLAGLKTESGGYERLVVHCAWEAWQAARAQGGEAEASKGVTMDALSLREAAYWANPDISPDEDETEVHIEYMPKRTSSDGEEMAPGYYLYYIDCPEEGVIGPLGEDPVPNEALIRAHPSASVPFSVSELESLVSILHRVGDKAHMIGGQDAGYLIDRLADFLSATTPQPADNWIKCSERLPTEADEDPFGFVVMLWMEGVVLMATSEHVRSVFSQLDKEYDHHLQWTPTGLKRPTPPAEGAE